MAEQWTQRWRFELGRRPSECKIYLNDELWTNVVSFSIEGGADPTGHPMPTRLTFSVLPHAVDIEIAPSLQADLQEGLFGTHPPAGMA